jgi:hypothetical protein
LTVRSRAPRTSSGCLVAAVAVTALLGFGLLATLLSLADGEPAPSGTTGGLVTPPAGTVLLAHQGSGSLAAKLTATGPWELRWSFDCSGRPAGTGRFAVDPDGPAALPEVAERAARGGGARRVAAAGTYQVTVSSPCTWTLTAVTAAAGGTSGEAVSPVNPRGAGRRVRGRSGWRRRPAGGVPPSGRRSGSAGGAGRWSGGCRG